jgi:hypothetical protein
VGREGKSFAEKLDEGFSWSLGKIEKRKKQILLLLIGGGFEIFDVLVFLKV